MQTHIQTKGSNTYRQTSKTFRQADIHTARPEGPYINTDIQTD